MTMYNGPSIYNQGGGGGAYSDGGELVDGDTIEIKNNTLSVYENVSRGEINYYIVSQDGQVISAAVEIKNDVSAVVHVYVVDSNGFFVPLGNIGGDTMAAGETYKLNIFGDSFTLEQVTAPLNPDPEFVQIMGVAYPCKKINGLFWITENFRGDVGSYEQNGGNKYYLPRSVKDINLDGWRLPSYSETAQMKESIAPSPGDKIKSTTGWYSGGNGTNAAGLNVKPLGYMSSGLVQMATRESHFICTDDANNFDRVVCSYDSSNIVFSTQNYTVDAYYNVRLIYSP